MKKKFEDNVAAEMPKTVAGEPPLPWKIDEADLEKIESESQELKDMTRGEPPLKARPVFLVLLVVAIFLSAFIMAATVTVENEGIRAGMTETEGRAAALRMKVEKMSVEKEALEKGALQLEKRLSDLAAQKDLFSAVLESLAKKEVDAPAAANNAGQNQENPN
jgi:hypothetical protein